MSLGAVFQGSALGYESFASARVRFVGDKRDDYFDALADSTLHTPALKPPALVS